MRNVPLLQRHYELSTQVPVYMAAGFAAFLLYMKVTAKEGNKYFELRNGEKYEIKDDAADYFYHLWKSNSAEKVASTVMQNEELWETDLAKFPGFLNAVQEKLNDYLADGVLKTIAKIETKKEFA